MNGGQKNDRSDNKNVRIEILPQNTASLLKNNRPGEIENLFLRLYRYAYLLENSKGSKVKQYFPIGNSYFLRKYSHILLALDKKVLNILTKLNIHYEKFVISQSEQSRWAIGIGGDSPYGNLLLPTLHPLYGLPYIPASTLKGLIRNCWTDINCGGNEDAEEVLQLFGSSKKKTSDDEPGSEGKTGQLVFFDSYPNPKSAESGKLVKDVFTPHYPEYYKKFGDTPPTDDQNPVPVEFLCTENLSFNIYIGARKELSDNEKVKLKNTLNHVFSEHGIGAKTALGYGYGTERC